MVKKGIFCLCMTVFILGGCTLGGVSLKGKEKLAEPDFVLTYAENQAEDYPTTQGAYKFAELVNSSRVYSQAECTSDALSVYRSRSYVEGTGRSYRR